MKLLKFKNALVLLTLACGLLFATPNALSDELSDCERLINETIEEIDRLTRECEDIATAIAAERDEAIRLLAAESAVRAGLQWRFNELEKAFFEERELRIREEATRPSRLVWAGVGAGGTIVLVILVAVVAR